MRQETVIRHGEDGFAGMRKAGRLAAAVLDMITPHVAPGVTTDELDRFCHDNGKTIIMVSHDLSAIRQTTHRMIFLEEKIRFDGPTANFPDLESLAKLRGISHTHEQENDQWWPGDIKEER